VSDPWYSRRFVSSLPSSGTTIWLWNFPAILTIRSSYWLFAASETKFFLRTEETQIEFQRNADGKVLEIVIHNSDGRVVRGPRIEPASLR
jgi:hypothetical protein